MKVSSLIGALILCLVSMNMLLCCSAPQTLPLPDPLSSDTQNLSEHDVLPSPVSSVLVQESQNSGLNSNANVFPIAPSSPQPVLSASSEPLDLLPAAMDLKFLSLRKTALTLSWREVNQAVAYRVYQNDQLIAETAAHLWFVKELVAGRVYTFSVIALDGNGYEGLPAQLEVRLPKNTSSGGGGSASFTPSLPEVELIVSQNPVPGPGHSVYLTVQPTEIVAHLPASAFSWECLEDCAFFEPSQGLAVVWTAPYELISLEESFTLKLTITLDSGDVLKTEKIVQVLNHHQDLNVMIWGAN